MKKLSILITGILFLGATAFAQPQTREELEKQKQQLKKELKETELMLSENKAKTKENFLQWKLISDKVNLQDRLVENINNDINLLDRSLTSTQRDINKFDRLLDTLKQEYAKSMVYAYKNRSNYDFLNFIFSAASFNDAIKRVAYLKSYRNYREMQGQNIIRTQELRKQRVEELTGTKQKKSVVLQSKDQELNVLEQQQKEKDRVLNELKKQGKSLNDQYAAKVAKMRRVENSIAANIKRVLDEQKKAAALLKAAAKKKADEEAEAERKRIAKEKTKNPISNPTAGEVVKNPNPTPREPKTPRIPADGPTTSDEYRKLEANFKANKGNLPWSVNGTIIIHFGKNVMPGSGTVIDSKCVTIATQIGASVKAIFNGEVTAIFEDDGGTVMIQHGGYFSTYTNLSSITVKKGQQVVLGQVLGKAMSNLDGVGSTDLYLYDEKAKYYDPQSWLHR